MTRDEFVVAYMARSELSPHYRTVDGFHIPGTLPRRAVPCDCGEAICEGWQMLNEELAREQEESDDVEAAPRRHLFRP